MESWRCYHKRLLENFRCPDLTLVEKTLLGVVLMMLVLNSVSLLATKDVGDLEEVRLAKLQAQQELMALKSVGD